MEVCNLTKENWVKDDGILALNSSFPDYFILPVHTTAEVRMKSEGS